MTLHRTNHKRTVNVALLAQLREEQGLSQGQIARRLKMSVGSVAYHCLVHNIEHPTKKPVIWTAAREGRVERRGNHVVRRFTPAEDAQLIALEQLGLNYAEIGRRLGGRTSNSIRSRLATLARRQERGVM